MEDRELIGLYNTRSQSAVAATMDKYGRLCRSIAMNILGDEGDAEECVNDAYLAVWNSIPPNQPAELSAYIGKIVRNLALNRRRAQSAQKRGGGQYDLAYEELESILSGGRTTEEAVDRRRLAEALDAFLAGLPEMKRRIFMQRYWWFRPVADIAAETGYSQSKVKMILLRLRAQLRGQLEEEGLL